MIDSLILGNQHVHLKVQRCEDEAGEEKAKGGNIKIKSEIDVQI